MSEPTTSPSTAPEGDGVRIIVAFSPDAGEIGSTRTVSRAEARQLIDEGRARLADGDPEDPDAPAGPSTTAPAAPPATGGKTESKFSKQQQPAG